jgi:hypothetical protein
VRELVLVNYDLLFAEEEGTGKTLRDIAEDRKEAYQLANVESIVWNQRKRLESEIAAREHSYRPIPEDDTWRLIAAEASIFGT